MSKQLSKYVVSTIKAINYDIEEYHTDEGDTVYALTYNGFLHSDWMTHLEIEAFAHGVSRALHAVNGEWRINQVLEDMAKEEEAAKAKMCVDTAKGEECQGQGCCDKCAEGHSECVEGHNEYVVLEGDCAFACVFSDALSALEDVCDLIDNAHRHSKGKDK